MDYGAGARTPLGRPGRALARHPVLLMPSAGGPPYLQAVGAWLRRRRRRRLLVRLEEDLLAPPEELDNSDEDVVQHQDHARSRPPARRPGRCARSARPRQLRRVRGRVRPGPAQARPLPAPRPRGPAYPPAAERCTSRFVQPAEPPRVPLTAWLSPPFSLRSQDSSSLSAIRIPYQVASSQLPLAPQASRPSYRYLASRSPSLVGSRPLPQLRKSWGPARAPSQRPAQ